MNDLDLTPTEELVDALKRRNLTLIVAWCDHQQFDKQTDGIVWGVDHSGALPLKLAMLTLLTKCLDHLSDQKTIPGTTEA